MAGDRIFNFNGPGVVFNDIHDNHNCTIIVPKGKSMDELENPKEGDYKAVVRWLEYEKANGRDWYKLNNNNRSQMCREISGILGWEVSENSLRKAQ